MNVRLEPFDLLLVTGATRVGKAIRWATGTKTAPAHVSHVGFIVESGDLWSAVAQEALMQTRCIDRRTIGEGYAGRADLVSFWRPLNLTAADKMAMRSAADLTLGCGYGFTNIGLQLVDALLGKALRRRVHLARRFSSRRWHECSHDVALVWQAAGYDFGVDNGMATPDAIHDFCVERPDRYALVRALAPVPAQP